MHEIERQMKADDEQPEMQAGEALVVHAAGHLRKPVVKGSEDREQDPADDHIVKVGDHEVRVAELPVERRRAEHDAGQARHQELKQKRDAEQHRRLEIDLPAPHRRQPVEDLDSRRDSNGHRRQNEERIRARRHPDGEHVMRPDAHRDEGDADRRADHDRIPEDRLA